MNYFVLAAALIISSSALAQTAQPYAGLQSRPIKALSEQQIADLRAGRGAGFALAAELNGYPGPVHVLELGDRLNLSAAQREQVQKLFVSMKAEAVPLGEQLISREEELDRPQHRHAPRHRVVVGQSFGACGVALQIERRDELHGGDREAGKDDQHHAGHPSRREETA